VIAGLVGVSERAGRNALESLAASDILAPLTTSDGHAHTHRYKWWYAPDVTALIASI
jgi:hypothetical protein